VKKILSVVGARPQFIKAAPVSRALRRNCEEILVHTGQHYDRNMSQVFFEELEMPEPDYNLGVGSGTHAWQTGQMLTKLGELLLLEKPDRVLVYGDTNSTLAGALAAAKLSIPVAHVEAGLRSCNRSMPEEINRVLTDHLSSLLFCPTRQAVANLAAEGFKNIIDSGSLVDQDSLAGMLRATPENPLVVNTGDVMYDALLFNLKIAESRSDVLQRLGLMRGGYYLATVHRAENTDDPERLKNILEALGEADRTVILPLHPRTMQAAAASGLKELLQVDNIRVLEPVSYLDNLILEKNAKAILTDSGGMQKEAYLLGVHCITLRQETEWVETVEAGANILVGSDKQRISLALSIIRAANSWTTSVYGNGSAAEIIISCLMAGV
jgi:UDP-N-acetylglucosamine 2-epimerase